MVNNLPVVVTGACIREISVKMSDRLDKMAQLAILCWIGGLVLWVLLYSWVVLAVLEYVPWPGEDVGVPYLGGLIELALILAGVSAIALGTGLRRRSLGGTSNHVAGKRAIVMGGVVVFLVFLPNAVAHLLGVA